MPWDIERLTDWQIEKLIIAPAVKKAKEMDPNKMPDMDPAATSPDRPLPTEDEFVAMSMQSFGGTSEGWRNQYRAAMMEDERDGSCGG
jgi:hypothetical protein